MICDNHKLITDEDYCPHCFIETNRHLFPKTAYGQVLELLESAAETMKHVGCTMHDCKPCAWVAQYRAWLSQSA